MLLAKITALATFCQACGSRGAWWWCSPLPPLSWACAEASNVRTSTPSEAINSSPLNPADFFKRAIQPSNPNPLDTRTDARCSVRACCGVGSNMWASPSGPTSAVTLTSGPAPFPGDIGQDGKPRHDIQSGFGGPAWRRNGQRHQQQGAAGVFQERARAHLDSPAGTDIFRCGRGGRRAHKPPSSPTVSDTAYSTPRHSVIADDAAMPRRKESHSPAPLPARPHSTAHAICAPSDLTQNLAAAAGNIRKATAIKVPSE